MKQRIPSRLVEICDICKREGGLLTKCLVCGCDYCITCSCIIAGCWVSPNVCKKCDDRQDVIDLCSKYADEITPIIKRRDKALARLPAVLAPSDPQNP